jgi:predicted aminopeptidase
VSGERILVVDDGSDMREFVIQYVLRPNGFSFLEARDGLEALDQIADEKAFESLVGGLHAELDAVYRSSIGREQKLERKAELIAAFQADFESTKSARFRTEPFRAMRAPKVNNAYLSLFSLYSDDVPLIRSYYQKVCGSALRRLLVQARALARQGDVKAQMRRALFSSPA